MPLDPVERTNTSRVIQPLSNLSVKAVFDAPRIFFGKRLNLYVGPKSTVLLDTTYCDDKLRIGMGGTSGTRFVFARTQSPEASMYRTLLRQRPVSKPVALMFLSSVGVGSIYYAAATKLRWLGGLVGVISFLFASLIAFSSGGIERDDRSVRFRREDEAAAVVGTQSG